MSTSNYTGPSVVDYLTSVGQASDYNSRASLATKYGISGYAGTADQNTQLLNMLRSGASAPQSPTPTPTPTGGGATSPVPQPTNQTPTSSYTPPAATSANDLRTQLTNDQIDANGAKTQLTQRLAQSYGGTIVNGSPQFTNPQAQQAYQAALPAALAGLFAGLGDVKQGGQFGEFDTNGNFAKKSTTVNTQNFSTGGPSSGNTNVAVLKGQPNIDATHQYGSPVTGYFATYAEAVNAANNINNGVNLGANAPAGPTTTAPTGAPAPIAPAPVVAGNPAPVPGAPATGAVPTAPQVDANGNPIPPAPLAPPGNPAGPGGGAQSTYAGPSVVDYLNSIGQASDFSSRAKIASNLGIQNYTGSASQNTQMLNSLRSAGGGKSTSTATAGAAAGAGGAGAPGDGTNLSPDTQTILANATAIAKSFGWTAPDPNNSPLNIATNLFQQGLQQYGLTDLKTQINSVLQQQTDLQNAQADEVATVNSNPWLTEGERVNRINKIGDKYATKLDILTHQQQLYEADYKTGLDQVQWQVGQAMTAYNNAQTQNDDIFKEGLSLAEKQVDAQNALAAAKATAAGKTTTLSPGSILVDANGKTIASAPRAPTAGTKPTQQDKQDTAYNQINQLLTMKDSAGTPYLDGNGYLNPDLFKNLITAAAADGISRKDFLAQYGSYIYQDKASSYGLTPAEQKTLGFTQ